MQNIRWSELFTREINLKFLLTNDKISCVKKFVLYCRMLKKKKKRRKILQFPLQILYFLTERARIISFRYILLASTYLNINIVQVSFIVL